MKLTEFITTIQTSPEKLYQYPRIIFTGQSYPVLFFSYIATAFNKKQPGMLTLIDPEIQEDSQIRAQLQTSFLGMQRMFWFGSSSSLESSASKEWARFLDNYSGPNTVLFYREENQSKAHALELALPQQVDKKMFQAIVSLTGLPAHSGVEEFSKTLFERVQSVSLEHACLLAQYAGLMGAKNSDFFDDWFDRIAVADSSLFTLSQYFFAQDAKSFFVFWAKIHSVYGEPFWITYFSEQLFRAHAFVTYMRQGNRAQAQRVSYKLPFSFMQRDWKKYQPEMLKRAHDELYHLDYQFKNGGTPYALDLFYSRFFENKY